uniref:Uncharacterized protein n=1 Tax=Strombidium inclinatum TaxID=197538 RepID=A0A7S3ILD4_9SPIT
MKRAINAALSLNFLRRLDGLFNLTQFISLLDPDEGALLLKIWLIIPVLEQRRVLSFWGISCCVVKSRGDFLEELIFTLNDKVDLLLEIIVGCSVDNMLNVQGFNDRIQVLRQLRLFSALLRVDGSLPVDQHIGVAIVLASELRLQSAWLNRRHSRVIELEPIIYEAGL